MPDWLSIHQPVLVNTVGHCAGAVIFAILFYLFLVNWRRTREDRSRLPVVAAALAMLWNLGSLFALGTGPESGAAADIIVAVSFSLLSLLPAVLLHISLESRHRAVWIAGYALSATAVLLHACDAWTRAPRLHYAALLLVTVGFAILTIVSMFLEARRDQRGSWARLAGSMGLFLFAISFAHFRGEASTHAWSGEIALHHAGLPLALLVLLQDYRFLLLDTFLRFVVNAALTVAALLLAIRVVESPELARRLQNPFDAGLLFVSACLLLTLFISVRNRVPRFLTRVIFLRSSVEDAAREIEQVSRATRDEGEFLTQTAEIAAGFVHTTRFTLCDECPLPGAVLTTPIAVLDSASGSVPGWVRAVAPLRFSRGDARYLLLGPRAGGRRYLSEDFEILGRLTNTIVGQVEQLRGSQMLTLVSQAELRALQAQINPHFLFNSLNTLYGTIDRSNVEARRLVLNLSDVFRYLLRSDRTFIEVREELKIVRAYLEIEELRLGSKLRIEWDVDDAALGASIPLLSIQPLVENAVKHGVATRAGGGFVRLTIRVAHAQGGISVRIANSGECDLTLLTNPVRGIGLTNVRRRLELCYGEGSRFEAVTAAGVTTVGFELSVAT